MLRSPPHAQQRGGPSPACLSLSLTVVGSHVDVPPTSKAISICLGQGPQAPKNVRFDPTQHQQANFGWGLHRAISCASNPCVLATICRATPTELSNIEKQSSNELAHACPTPSSDIKSKRIEQPPRLPAFPTPAPTIKASYKASKLPAITHTNDA